MNIKTQIEFSITAEVVFSGGQAEIRGSTPESSQEGHAPEGEVMAATLHLPTQDVELDVANDLTDEERELIIEDALEKAGEA